MTVLHLMIATLGLLSLASGEVRGGGGGGGRGRRSDDLDPLEAVVSGLSQKLDQLTQQLAALDAYSKSEIGQLKTRVGKYQYTIQYNTRQQNTMQ